MIKMIIKARLDGYWLEIVIKGREVRNPVGRFDCMRIVGCLIMRGYGGFLGGSLSGLMDPGRRYDSLVARCFGFCLSCLFLSRSSRNPRTLPLFSLFSLENRNRLMNRILFYGLFSLFRRFFSLFFSLLFNLYQWFILLFSL